MVLRLPIALLLFLLLMVSNASAQINVAAGEDARCIALCAKRAAEKPPRPCPTPPEMCMVTVDGKATIGVCMPNGCKGQSFTGLDGKTQGVGDMKGFMDALKGVMDLLKQAMQGQQQQQQQQPQTGTQGCTAYYQVNTPTTDPCAYYVPPTSSSLLTNTSLTDATSGSGTNVSDLLSALGGGTSGGTTSDYVGQTPVNVSDQLLNLNTNLNTNVKETGGETTGGGFAVQPTPIPASPTPAGTTGNLADQAVNLQAGVQGNIEITPGGVTVIARSRDTQANTEIAGFYGSPTIGGEQPQGLVARLCKSRPWAASIVTYLIPPSFFDSLCAWRGYQVGTPTPPPSPVVVQQVRPATPPPVSSTSTVSSVAPEVDIWAVPARVPLGTRTSVFWNTKGVDSCTISSPDGSFEEHALSGGAATVPLTGATTFTISCLTPGGQPVTDYVTVGLSI